MRSPFLDRRSESALGPSPRMRAVLVAGGLVTLALVWLSPLTRLLPGPFSAHMTMHMGVVAVAAPLLAFGLAGSRFDPARLAPSLLSPVPLSVIEMVVVWGWHTPALHMFARHTGLGLVLEQGMFLASGLLVWVSSVGGDARAGGDRAGGGMLALLLTTMHMTLLGALFALPPRLIFTHAHGQYDISPLADQHLGGAIMLIVGGISYLAGGLWLLVVMLKRRWSGTAAPTAGSARRWT